MLSTAPQSSSTFLFAATYEYCGAFTMSCLCRCSRSLFCRGVRYRDVERVRRTALSVCAATLIASLFVGGAVFLVFDRHLDKRLQTLECPALKHDHLKSSGTACSDVESSDVEKNELGDGIALIEVFNKVGILRGRIKGGGDVFRAFDDAPFEGGWTRISQWWKFVLVPFLSFTVSKIIGSVLHDYTEIRYSAIRGVSMERLFLARLVDDPLYAWFGERMKVNPLQLHAKANRPTMPVERHHIVNKGITHPIARRWCMRRPLFWGLAYFLAVTGVELFANFASQGRERNVNPAGGGNYTMEIQPLYKQLSGDDKDVQFLGLRKCSQFRVEIEGVVGPDDDDDDSKNGGNRGYVNSLMSCGTYYEPEIDSSPGPSQLDKRGVCTWKDNLDADRVEVYLGNSLCNKSGFTCLEEGASLSGGSATTRGTLNVRFRARDYDGERNGKPVPSFKAVGVSLTSNPFAARPKADPQVSFDLTCSNQSILISKISSAVQEFNNGGSREAKNLDILRKRKISQITDTDVIEFTEAIVQNIFFHSKYSFQAQTAQYCEDHGDECLGVSLGRTRTRRGFVWAAIAPLFAAFVCKVAAIWVMGSLYVREISPIFEDSLFSSLHERSTTGYSAAFVRDHPRWVYEYPEERARNCVQALGRYASWLFAQMTSVPEFVRVQRGFCGDEGLRRYRYVIYENEHSENVSRRTITEHERIFGTGPCQQVLERQETLQPHVRPREIPPGDFY